MFSICLVTHNRNELTKRCIESIEKHTETPHRYIFVDNNSTDNTLDYVASLRDELTLSLIENEENKHLSAALEQARLEFLETNNSYFFYIDNGSFIKEQIVDDFLVRIMEIFANDSDLGAIALCADVTQQHQQLHDSTLKDEVTDSFQVTPPGIIYRREVLEENEFDANLTDIGWDVDISRRIHSSGSTLATYWGATITHDHGVDGSASVDRDDYANRVRKNEQYFNKKWGLVSTPTVEASTQPVTCSTLLKDDAITLLQQSDACFLILDRSIYKVV